MMIHRRWKWLFSLLGLLFVVAPSAAQSMAEPTEDDIGSLRLSIASHPSRADLRMRLGAALEDAGHCAEALTEFRDAARMKPHDPLPWLRIGLIERLVFGRNREALAAFQHVIELDPGCDAAWYYSGLTAGDLASWPMAVAALEEAMRRQPPGHPVGKDYLSLYCAVLELADRRPHDARRRLSILQSINPGFAKTLEALLAQADE